MGVVTSAIPSLLTVHIKQVNIQEREMKIFNNDALYD